MRSRFDSSTDSGVCANQLLRAGPSRAVLPDELVERRRLAQLDRRPRVLDRRLDLAAMADDPGVAEQPLDVALAEARDRLRVEAGERVPEVLPLAQDRQPGEPGLEALEAEPLVDAGLVA